MDSVTHMLLIPVQSDDGRRLWYERSGDLVIAYSNASLERDVIHNVMFARSYAQHKGWSFAVARDVPLLDELMRRKALPEDLAVESYDEDGGIYNE